MNDTNFLGCTFNFAPVGKPATTLTQPEDSMAAPQLSVVTADGERVSDQGYTARDAWQHHCAGDPNLKDSTKSDHITSLGHWERACGDVPLAAIDETTLRAVPGEMTTSAARKVFSLISKLRSLEKLPAVAAPTLKKVRHPPGGKAVTLREFAALLSSCRVATWPRIGGLPPGYVWETWLLLWWIYGARTQDFVGYKLSSAEGLRWESVLLCEDLPGYIDVSSRHGWLNYTPAKTAESSGRSVEVALHQAVRPRLERFLGLDDERVFPNGRSQKPFAENFAAIRTAAGVSDQVTICDRSPKRSLRKSANAHWNTLHPQLGEYVLGHKLSGTNAVFYQELPSRTAECIDRIPLPELPQTAAQKRLFF